MARRPRLRYGVGQGGDFIKHGDIDGNPVFAGGAFCRATARTSARRVRPSILARLKARVLSMVFTDSLAAFFRRQCAGRFPFPDH